MCIVDNNKVVSLSMAVKVARAKVVKVCFDCFSPLIKKNKLLGTSFKNDQNNIKKKSRGFPPLKMGSFLFKVLY
jgi:hypothetical protein